MPLSSSLHRLTGLTAACVALLVPAGAAHAAPDAAGRYIVVYRSSVDAPGATTTQLQRREGFTPRLRFSRAIKGFSARLSGAQIDALRDDPDVALVTPDRPLRASGGVPVVSGDGLPAGVRRIGAGTAASASAPATAREASTAKVAVLDSGIDASAGEIDAVDAHNCVSGESSADLYGHGTHVAGTIAARNDGSSVTGVAPGTRLYSVKVLDATGNGSWSGVICGIDWVTSTRTDADPTNDIDVANLSLTGTGTTVEPCIPTMTDVLHLAICRSTARGVTYVVAAGNAGQRFDDPALPTIPAAYPEVLTVTAMSDADGAGGAAGGVPACRAGEADDAYATFSNFAVTAEAQAHTVAAPGTCVESTARGGGLATMSGTSMAAPHVTGEVALCIAEGGIDGPCHGLTPAGVIAKVRADAAAHASAVPTSGFTGDPAHPVAGRYYGPLVWAGLPAAAPATPLVAGALYPAAVEPQAGVVTGAADRLRADDDALLQAASTSTATRAIRWIATVPGVSNAVRSLRVTFRGRSTAACAQTVSIYRWTTGTWTQLDARGVGATEALVDRLATGTLADFVSGTTGAGEVRVRVACSNTSRAFTHSADLLRVTAGV